MIDLDDLLQRAGHALKSAHDLASLEAERLRFLGRQGEVTEALRSVGTIPQEQRRDFGAKANHVRTKLEALHAERRAAIEAKALAALEDEALDVSLPGRKGMVGRLHPITQTMRDMLDALGAMGFQVTEGPEVEWEYYNFNALRIPEYHPSRDTQDTFWLNYRSPEGKRPMLLRTQTSPNQIRFMERHQPPIRVAVPGRVYRYEATDATHEWMFHQVEILAVDEGISMRQLKGTLTQFAQALFGRHRAVRFRCHYFPFVEPGAEVDIQCELCKGAGCRSCGNEGWLEIAGCGMVHREILDNVGYDSDRYTGFAAGFGVERIAMLRHDIDDIRHFYANDLRFLRQF